MDCRIHTHFIQISQHKFSHVRQTAYALKGITHMYKLWQLIMGVIYIPPSTQHCVRNKVTQHTEHDLCAKPSLISVTSNRITSNLRQGVRNCIFS